MDERYLGGADSPPPLVVDLDGTLIHTDTLHEGALRMLRDHPLHTFRIPIWLAEGKAVLKQRLASRSLFDPSTLPYNESLLDWLRNQRAAGRKIVLCTAADRSLAQSVADHLGVFDDVMASDGALNLSGSNKAAALERRFGRAGFDYAGNSSADFAVWELARRAIVVNASSRVAAKAAAQCQVERTFPPKPRGPAAWRRVFRVHQWLKNLLLLVPMLAAHEWADADMLQLLVLAFLSFSICASSVYVANDLLDLESDRLHPRKRNRPFASGTIPVWVGVVLAPMLLAASTAAGAIVGGQFLQWLAVYFLLTCAYSWGLKRVMLVDCLTLAMLYTLRIIAGAAAVGLDVTFWLLAFSVFLFLSLAFVKRYAELEAQLLTGRQTLHGRGYHTADAPLIHTMGITSGYASVLVLALYLNSDAVLRLYRMPEVIWGTIPVMLFWISWMWMQAHRGRMHDDPLVFAVKDPASLAAGIAFAAVMVLGKTGLPW